jgi:hypothetical protein
MPAAAASGRLLVLALQPTHFSTVNKVSAALLHMSAASCAYASCAHAGAPCPALQPLTLQLLHEPMTLMTVRGERATGLLDLKQNSMWQFLTHSRLLLMLP